MKVDELLRTPKLEFVFIRLNNVCNAKCEFCDVWKTPQIHSDPEIDFSILMQEICEFKPIEVNLHGGEAFLSKNYAQILESAQNKLDFSITTNGSALTAKNIDKISKLGVTRLYISIDHADSKLNSISRGIPSLEKTLDSSLKYLSSVHPHIEIIINHVVSSFNYSTIKAFLLKMKEMSVTAVNLIPIKDYPKLYLTVGQINEFNTEINDIISSSHFKRSFFLNGLMRPFGYSVDQALNASKGVYNFHQKSGCIIPTVTMFIDAVSGDVYPCDTTMYRENKNKYVMGNVKSESLSQIWLGDKFSTFRKEMHPSITHNCINGCDPANVLFFDLK